MKQKVVDFSQFSSIKIGPSITVNLIEACEDFKNISDGIIIGSCNNMLISNNPPSLYKLDKKFDYIKIIDGTLRIGAATPSGKIASFCKKHNIANFEFVSHLPGTLGGLVFMNAGLKEYEIFNHLISVKTCYGELAKEAIEHGYRYTKIDSLIVEATFELSYGFDIQKVELFKKMRVNQPSTPSAGSCFKNPQGDYAGRLIEAVELKGLKVGDMEFSTTHANFLVNNGKGTFDEAMFLIDEAKRRVLEKFNISLECEIKIV